jgi:hypothetical protein
MFGPLVDSKAAASIIRNEEGMSNEPAVEQKDFVALGVNLFRIRECKQKKEVGRQQ